MNNLLCSELLISVMVILVDAECSYKYLNKTCLTSNYFNYDYTSTEDDQCDENCKSITGCTASLFEVNYCLHYKAPVIFVSNDLDLNQCIEKCPNLSPGPDLSPDPSLGQGPDPSPGPDLNPDPSPGQGPDPTPDQGPDPTPDQGPDPSQGQGPGQDQDQDQGPSQGQGQDATRRRKWKLDKDHLHNFKLHVLVILLRNFVLIP
ncbi:hypothetical protein LOTGIDRAFT_235790 [Lottia gigantea]|uniref:Apple domain-containing protein n=1 Tax=Lottia gigantea TaxID=225164 RepID=V3ZWD0_LOTGI|nr:hypothetical protein LOTGIDRAFT_235790 [Lottia gigantea]ESO85266.1 hypothetical protein LOTGIDRAFT_235790 [Lottia gigantea]